MKLLILLHLGICSLVSCIAGESACRVFVNAQKPYELPLVKEELLSLTVYPLDYIADIEKLSKAFRITKCGGGWGEAVSYTIKTTENENAAIYSKKFIIVDQKDSAILLKSSLINNDELNFTKKMIFTIKESVKKHADSTDELSSNGLAMNTPFVLIEYFSEEGYKGSLVLPAGYHLLSKDTEKLLHKLEAFVNQGKDPSNVDD